MHTPGDRGSLGRRGYAWRRPSSRGQSSGSRAANSARRARFIEQRRHASRVCLRKKRKKERRNGVDLRAEFVSRDATHQSAARKPATRATRVPPGQPEKVDTCQPQNTCNLRARAQFALLKVLAQRRPVSRFLILEPIVLQKMYLLFLVTQSFSAFVFVIVLRFILE